MIKSDFYGNSFIWFTGRVESRSDDPLKMGCVRVRIFGLHPFLENGDPDISKVATNDLPWAQLSLPAAGSKAFSSPREGEWVFGFFQDGPNAQVPVILSVYSGIERENSNYINAQGELTSVNAFMPADIQARARPNNLNPNLSQYPTNKSTTAPMTPAGVGTRFYGEPIIPRTARGIVSNTIVDRTNQYRSHACDVVNKLKTEVGIIKVAFGVVLQTIRDAVRAFLAALGLDPTGIIRKVLFLIQQIRAIAQWIQKFIEEIQAWKQVLFDFIAKVRELINFILNLPAYLINLLRNCIVELLSGIADGVLGLFGSASGSGLGDLIREGKGLANDLLNLAGGVADIVATPAQALDVFLNGTNYNYTLNQTNRLNQSLSNKINNFGQTNIDNYNNQETTNTNTPISVGGNIINFSQSALNTVKGVTDTIASTFPTQQGIQTNFAYKQVGQTKYSGYGNASTYQQNSRFRGP